MKTLLSIYGHFIFPWIIAIIGLVLMRYCAKKIVSIVVAFERSRQQFQCHQKRFNQIWSTHEKRKELIMWYILLTGSIAIEYVAYWYYQLLHNLN